MELLAFLWLNIHPKLNLLPNPCADPIFQTI
jgi:hypothetical protein